MIETQIQAVLNALAPTTSRAAAGNARPRITYYRVAGTDNPTLRTAGPKRARFQIDVYADSLATARGLADQAAVALRAGLTVGEITDNPDDFETDTQLHKCSFDAAIWF